ncbi:MAG: hypothetical protein AAB436_02500 [Patescibacteria group bacterium]
MSNIAETRVSTNQLYIVRRAISPTILDTPALVDTIGGVDHEGLRAGNWTETYWRQNDTYDGMDKTVLDAGFYPKHQSPVDGYILRGAAGECIRVMMTHPPDDTDGRPSDASIRGISKTGEFDLSYHRGFRSAGPTATTDTGTYSFGFNLREGDARVRIKPLPLGQLVFEWDNTIDGGIVDVDDSSSVIKFDKDNLEVHLADAYHFGSGSRQSFEDVLTWYKELRMPDKNPEELERWLEALPDTIELGTLAARAKSQAAQAFQAIEAVLEDPSRGTKLPFTEYVKL